MSVGKGEVSPGGVSMRLRGASLSLTRCFSNFWLSLAETGSHVPETSVDSPFVARR